jgi:hypothetical protein
MVKNQVDSMAHRRKKFVTLILLMVVLVAFFQFIWHFFYDSPFIMGLNPYPTQEYLQILWLFSPDGLSILTLIFGVIALAWTAFASP